MNLSNAKKYIYRPVVNNFGAYSCCTGCCSCVFIDIGVESFAATPQKWLSFSFHPFDGNCIRLRPGAPNKFNNTQLIYFNRALISWCLMHCSYSLDLTTSGSF